MLVVVDRNRAAIRFEDLAALLEKFEAGIQYLALVVARVVAVFADDQHGIDGEFVTAAAQRFGDGRIHLEPELLRALLAEIARRVLVHVQRDDLHVGLVPGPVDRIANQEAVADMLAVRKVAVDGGDDGDALRAGLLGEGGGGDGESLEEVSAVHEQGAYV